jgi:hypothetical protein
MATDKVHILPTIITRYPHLPVTMQTTLLSTLQSTKVQIPSQTTTAITLPTKDCTAIVQLAFHHTDPSLNFFKFPNSSFPPLSRRHLLPHRLHMCPLVAVLTQTHRQDQQAITELSKHPLRNRLVRKRKFMIG